MVRAPSFVCVATFEQSVLVDVEGLIARLGQLECVLRLGLRGIRTQPLSIGTTRLGLHALMDQAVVVAHVISLGHRGALSRSLTPNIASAVRI